MARINIEQQVNDEQALAMSYISKKINECLNSGFNYRLIMDVQKGRISGIQAIEFISGATQYLSSLDKFN